MGRGPVLILYHQYSWFYHSSVPGSAMAWALENCNFHLGTCPGCMQRGSCYTDSMKSEYIGTCPGDHVSVHQGLCSHFLLSILLNCMVQKDASSATNCALYDFSYLQQKGTVTSYNLCCQLHGPIWTFSNVCVCYAWPLPGKQSLMTVHFVQQTMQI